MQTMAPQQNKKVHRIRAIFNLLPLASILFFSSCSEPLINRDPTGKLFPKVNGISLDHRQWSLPADLLGRETILLIGYVQDAQFDIDRWLIGLDMRSVKTKMYEVPTIKGMVPRLISERINQGMRSGIPKELWGGVITVYDDGEFMQRFTGNERPRNARILLLDRNGVIRYFTDEGFSVAGLNRLIKSLNLLQRPSESSHKRAIKPPQ